MTERKYQCYLCGVSNGGANFYLVTDTLCCRCADLIEIECTTSPLYRVLERLGQITASIDDAIEHLQGVKAYVPKADADKIVECVYSLLERKNEIMGAQSKLD